MTDAGLVVTTFPSYLTVIAELAAKPLPVTVTVVPVPPEDGEREMRVLTTVNGAEALLTPSDAPIVCCPSAVPAGTAKVAENAPAELEVTDGGVVVSCAPSIVIAIAVLGAKPLPLTVTVLPPLADVGFSVTNALVTENGTAET